MTKASESMDCKYFEHAVEDKVSRGFRPRSALAFIVKHAFRKSMPVISIPIVQ
jgi:hypothetical protein